MSGSFKTKVVSALSNEISLLNGSNFEQFSYLIMEIVKPPEFGRWHERGTTITGAPRGYTIDASLSGSETIAEFSSEENYFSIPPKKRKGTTKKPVKKRAKKKTTVTVGKPERDIKHALTLHPTVEKIFLLSTNNASPRESTALDGIISDYKKANTNLKEIEILDARQIALEIFNNLESDTLINRLSSYLPSLERLADEHAISHRIPTYEGYISRPGIEGNISQSLVTQPTIQLSGISGIGKSALAAQVARNLSDDYEAIYWINGKDLHSANDLSDIDVRRNGTHHNLLANMRRMKCLLIIDEIGFPWEQIEGTSIGTSNIIATTQTATTKDSIQVSDVNDEQALEILSDQVSDVLTDALSKRILSIVGGFPLILSALNRIAREDGWSAVEECLSDCATSIEDDQNQKICRRILQHHMANLRDELAFVKWCDSQSIDISLGKHCVNSRWHMNIRKRGFLSASSYQSLKVHDIVYESIKAEVSVDDQQVELFLGKLKNMFSEGCVTDRVVLQRTANRHANLIKRILQRQESPELVYATALTRAKDVAVSTYSSLIAQANLVAEAEFAPSSDIMIRAIIESIESKFTLTYQTKGKDSAKKELTNDIEALKALQQIPKLPEDTLRDINHHYAKMLMRIDKSDDAKQIFSSILTDYPSCAAARLQYARILAFSDKNREGAVQEAGKICDQYSSTPEEVSPHILLEALRLIASVEPDQILNSRAFIHEVLERSGEFDAAMAVSLVSKISEKMWYTAPDFVAELFDKLDWCSIVPSSDVDRFYWAQAYKNAAKATMELELDGTTRIAKSLDYYRSIREANNYWRMHHSEAAIIAGEPQEAINVLDSVTKEQQNDHWHYRNADALYKLGKPAKATHHIERSIEMIEDERFLPARHALRAEIRILQSDSRGAKQDLELAISLTENPKYRSELEERLKKL